MPGPAPGASSGNLTLAPFCREREGEALGRDGSAARGRSGPRPKRGGARVQISGLGREPRGAERRAGRARPQDGHLKWPLSPAPLPRGARGAPGGAEPELRFCGSVAAAALGPGGGARAPQATLLGVGLRSDD